MAVKRVKKEFFYGFWGFFVVIVGFFVARQGAKTLLEWNADAADGYDWL